MGVNLGSLLCIPMPDLARNVRCFAFFSHSAAQKSRVGELMQNLTFLQMRRFICEGCGGCEICRIEVRDRLNDRIEERKYFAI